MKCIPVIIFCSAALYAADFVNGQAARAVIGQTTFTTADPNSSNTVLGAANGIAYAANTLFVADSNILGAAPVNNRVLMFQNFSSQLPEVTAELPYLTTCPVCVGTATVVLGQPNFADWQSLPLGTSTASSLRAPQGVWLQNGKLFVADTQNNRVLIWNSIPTSNGVAANVVLGFSNFTTYSATAVANQATSATASNMQDPVSVTSDGTHLFVSDLGYNRVLIWKSIPTSNGVPADVEIGQPDMVSSVADNAYSGTAATTAGSTDVETPVLCTESNGVDSNKAPTYPGACNATLSFPRFALSDGTRQ